MLRIRVWGWDDRFRVVLDLSGAVKHEDRVVADPDRFAINLRDTRAGEIKLPDPRDWMVQRIRLNPLAGGTTQVVLDLAGPAECKIFDLGPDGDKPYRVVCDVMRPREAPPRPPRQPQEPPPPQPAQRTPPEIPPSGKWTVVLDPGHGGHDPGVVHGRMQEKEIVLDVARRVAERLSREEAVEVHLTRERDVFVGLQERARRAQVHDADFFVSIHVNGFRTDAPRGAEVYFLSLQGATDVAAREVAALENAAAVEDSDPQLGEIASLPFAVDLLKTDTVRRSSLLAESILDQLVSGELAASRGVKQANFVVLRSCRVPSALVELGFVSNPEDARQLSSSEHRSALSDAIAEGILEFRTRFARRPHAASALETGAGGAALPLPSR